MSVVKRSLSIRGHRTSVSLEDPFWSALKDMAEADGRSLMSLVADIDARRGADNLSSAIRCHVLAHYRGKG
jgi:predicted DNA-binding ribbon-helix-helix protein